MTKVGFLLVAALLYSYTSVAQQTQDSWLIGYWEGELQDYAAQGGKGNPRRYIEVTAVAPDGTAQGVFGVDGQPPAKATVEVKGPKVHIVNAAKSIAALTREGDDRLVGTLTWTDGKVFSLPLVKVKCPDTASLIGQWTGEAKHAHVGGYRAAYYLNITRAQCNSVWGTWEFSYTSTSKGPFRGRVEGNQLTYGTMSLEIREKQMTGGFPAWKVILNKEK